MSKDQSLLLTSNELLRFDEALRELAEDSAAVTDVASDQPQLSEFESRTWLAQQQDPDAVMWHALALKLTGALDADRLAAAAHALVRAWPDLDARYAFGDDGDLVKSWAGGAGKYVEVARAASVQQAVELVLQRQAAGWDSEAEPPFRLVLVRCEQDMVLGLLTHRVLDGAYAPESILTGLAAAYNGGHIVPPSVRSVIEFGSNGSVVPWLYRPSSGGQVQVLGVAGPTGAPADNRARRYGATLVADAISGLGSGGGNLLQVLATVSVQFARFVGQFGGHDSVTLLVPQTPLKSLGDPALPISAADTLQFGVTAGEAGAAAIGRVLASLGAAGPGFALDSVSQGRPLAVVTWLADAGRFLNLEGVQVERLAVPTLAGLAEFALGVGVDSQQNVTLELVAGQALSVHAGAFVLEQFVAFLSNPSGFLELPGSPSHAVEAGVAGAPPELALHASDAVGREIGSAGVDVELILEEFRAALSSPDMGPDDDFFDFGGHSLVATRIIGRLFSNHGIEVSLNDLFSNSTAASLAQLATQVAPGSEGSGSDTESGKSLTAPLSLAQMSLWQAYSHFGFGPIFNLPFALDFVDPVDERLFGQAFADVLERHAGLRTLFIAEGDEVRQQVVPPEDLQGYKWFWTSSESEGVDRHAEAGYCFDLAKELPLRLRFMKDRDTGRQLLSFLFHHIVLDEWSVNLMMDELLVAFRARSAGEAPVWSTPTPAPFHEFARRQAQRGVDDEHLNYWTDMLRGSSTALPIVERSIPVPETQAKGSAEGGWVEIKLAPEETAGLYVTARDNSASLFNVVYAAIATALQNRDELTDLVIGTSASGRTDAEFFDTIGYFTTLAGHRVRFVTGMTVGELVKSVKDTVNESMQHGDIPISLVEAALGKTPGRDRLFEVFIQIHAQNKLNGTLPMSDGQGVEFRQVDPDKHESLLGLQFEVLEETIGGVRSIRLMMSYRADRYGPESVEWLRSRVHEVIARFAQSGASALDLAAVLDLEA